MNKNNKWIITGLVEEQRQSNAARIKVLSFKKGQDHIKDEQLIIDEFQPHGFVFVRNILDRFPVGTLVSVPVTFNEPHHSNDNYTGDGYSAMGCRVTGYRFFYLTNQVMLNSSSISLARLKTVVALEKPLKDFFVAIDQQVYGPFHYDGENVNAHAEVEVAEFDPELAVSSLGYHYFLKRPVALRKIDAMTPEQLTIWFKQKLKMLASPSLDEAETFLQETDFMGADIGRLNRSMTAIAHLKLGHNELLQLARTSTTLEVQYQQAIEKAWDEFTLPALQEAETMRLAIAKEQQTLDYLTESVVSAHAQQQLLQEDIAHLASERERLIRDLRVNSLVNPTLASHLATSELLRYVPEGEAYADYTAFIQHFCKALALTDSDELQSAFLAAGQLKDYRLLLAPQVEFVLQLAQATGRASVVLQHAEADWIKFDRFYNNGLKLAIDTALDEPENFTFLVIQQSNLSAIECYAGPLLDLIAGIRRQLPGTGQPLPDNLWLFFVPLPHDPDIPFGLPLIKSTYRNWGVFPRLATVNLSANIQGGVLSLEQMRNHSMPISPDLNAFFEHGMY
jgi:hypothetical protein